MIQIDMNTQDDNSTESHTLRFALTPSVTAGHATTVIPLDRAAHNVIRGIFERFPDEIPTSTKIFCTSQRNKYKFSIFFHVGSGGVFERFSSLD